MVAVTSSRFAVLATLCAVASVSYMPLTANAAAVEARHSDKKPTEGLPAEGDTRLANQPVIPLPHKLSKASVRGTAKSSVVEHGRIRKSKHKEHEENMVRAPVDQSIRIVQFPVKSARSLSQRHHDHDDDCPDKVIVNGDRDHVHLSCHHDHHDGHHDHHDHLEEVIVNGDRDHVRTRRESIVARSPRHARPLLQRRNDTAATGPASNGVLGTIEVQDTNPTSGQIKSYGEFLADNRGDHYEIKVSKNNHTTFKMIETSDALQSNDPKSGGVILEAVISESSDRFCCTYDAYPNSTAPMRLNFCQPDGNGGDGHASQRFSYDPATGSIKLIWAGSLNPASPAQSSNSTVTRRDDTQNTSSGGVDLIWRPASNSTTARVETTSSGVQTQTVTVTVTAGVESESSLMTPTSTTREASVTMGDSTSTLISTTPPTPVSSVSSSPEGLSQTQAVRASSDTGIATSASTQSSTSAANVQPSTSTSNELKIEVAPGDSSSANSVSASTSAPAASNTAPSDSFVATSHGASWGVPIRDGGVIDTVLQSRDVQSGMRKF